MYITSRFWILFLPDSDLWSRELGEQQKEVKATQYHRKEGKDYLLQAIPVKQLKHPSMSMTPETVGRKVKNKQPFFEGSMY